MNVKTPQQGMICASVRGRDSGQIYVVCSVEDARTVLVADGVRRKLSCPKRKNVKHLALTPHYLSEYGADLSNGTAGDCAVAYALKQYAAAKNSVGGEQIV